MHIADFVEDTASPDWILFVVFPSSSKKLPVGYLQLVHDHCFLHLSYPAVHWFSLQVKFAPKPIGSCWVDFIYRELFVYFILRHILSFLLKPVHYFTKTPPDCILIPHWVTYVGLCIFGCLTQSHLRNADTVPKSTDYTNCPKIWEPSQNLWCQKGEMKHFTLRTQKS